MFGPGTRSFLKMWPEFTLNYLASQLAAANRAVIFSFFWGGLNWYLNAAMF